MAERLMRVSAMRLMLRYAICVVLFWLALRLFRAAALLMRFVSGLCGVVAANVADADDSCHAAPADELPVVLERIEDRLFRTLH
jgi:hypothetical protein